MLWGHKTCCHVRSCVYIHISGHSSRSCDPRRNRVGVELVTGSRVEI